MRLIWTLRAQDDILDIAERYDAIDPDLADTIVARIETAPLALLDFPNQGERLRGRPERKWRVDRTPFVLLYDVGAGHIDVLRVVHVASDWRP